MKYQESEFKKNAERTVHILKTEAEKRHLRNLEAQEKKSAINRNRTLTIVGIIILILMAIAFIVNVLPELLEK